MNKRASVYLQDEVICVHCEWFKFDDIMYDDERAA